ncbi:T3SS (YopN, CesT) and YbjN peptide-binding chaperone 1 [Ornithinimicrobium sp. LYQ121]|uniref:T3SS (YopN, CesT) and YbjN peptide-binding chaperone 1 n=1 Tax=Ornithinimicrobium sp. LYQ121 TaxID=3378801 RepID=UPI003853F089
MEEFDLDRATQVAWAGFLTRLGTHLTAIDEPLTLMPYSGDTRRTPTITVTPEADTLHAVLHAPGPDWSAAERTGRLTAQGWRTEEDGTAYLLDLPRSHAHLLAAVTVDTLREVIGVPHPALLEAGRLTITPPTGAAPTHQGAEPTQEGAEPVPQIDLDAPVRVNSPAALRRAVHTTLHAALRTPPRHDRDDDVPIVYGSALVYVHTADAQPVVSVFTIAVQDVTDLDAARREVEILNRGSVFTKYRLAGRQIVGSVAIPCLPFVPRHLIGMVELVGRETDAMDEDLALRVGGRRWVDVISGGPRQGSVAPGREQGMQSAGGGGADPGAVDRGRANGEEVDEEVDEDEELPFELQTLLQLDAGGDARLEASLVADVCHRDRDLILGLLRVAEEQTLTWRDAVDEAREAADAEGVSAATTELRAWESTVRDLRGALRYVVTFGHPD